MYKQSSRDKLYRFTSFMGFIATVVEYNVVTLSRQYTALINGKYVPAISFTRNPYLPSGSRKKEPFGAVRITFDGNKLGQKYKIYPYNDPGYSNKNRDLGESEEAIIKSISSATDYILAVDIDYRAALQEISAEEFEEYLTEIKKVLPAYIKVKVHKQPGERVRDRLPLENLPGVGKLKKYYLFLDFTNEGSWIRDILVYSDKIVFENVFNDVGRLSETYSNPNPGEVLFILNKYPQWPLNLNNTVDKIVIGDTRVLDTILFQGAPLSKRVKYLKDSFSTNIIKQAANPINLRGLEKIITKKFMTAFVRFWNDWYEKYSSSKYFKDTWDDLYPWSLKKFHELGDTFEDIYEDYIYGLDQKTIGDYLKGLNIEFFNDYKKESIFRSTKILFKGPGQLNTDTYFSQNFNGTPFILINPWDILQEIPDSASPNQAIHILNSLMLGNIGHELTHAVDWIYNNYELDGGHDPEKETELYYNSGAELRAYVYNAAQDIWALILPANRATQRFNGQDFYKILFSRDYGYSKHIAPKNRKQFAQRVFKQVLKLQQEWIEDHGKKASASLSTIYYHGTKYEDKGKAIIESGFLKPGTSPSPKAQMAPIQGRVYLSKDPSYALMYALGGNMAGGTFPESIIKRDGRFGYLFAVKEIDSAKMIPDEDSVGKLIYLHKRGEVKAPDWFINLASYKLTDNQWYKILDGEYAYWAQGGKKLLKNMTSGQKKEILGLTDHVSHEGDLKIVGAWRIDKTRSKEFKGDGSNLFKIADKIPLPKRNKKAAGGSNLHEVKPGEKLYSSYNGKTFSLDRLIEQELDKGNQITSQIMDLKGKGYKATWAADSLEDAACYIWSRDEIEEGLISKEEMLDEIDSLNLEGWLYDPLQNDGDGGNIYIKPINEKKASYSEVDLDFCQRHNIDPDELGWLGKGDMGNAYEIDEGKVLKITRSANEYNIAKNLIGKNYENIANYYVAEEVGSEYYIIMENLDIDSNIEYLFNSTLEALSTQDLPTTYLSYFDEEEYEQEYGPLPGEIKEFIDELDNVVSDLRKAGLSDKADIHADNLGRDKNTGALKAFDLMEKN